MFTLTIETDGAAFGEHPEQEIARILQRVRDVLQRTQGLTGYSANLFDINGNNCGSWKLS